MKPHRMRMTHNLLLNYGLYRKMEVYRPHKATQVLSLHLNRLLQCCGSRIRLFSIPDPKCLHPGSRGLKGIRSRIRIRNTGLLVIFYISIGFTCRKVLNRPSLLLLTFIF
jgi:hypothetical protein